MILVWSSLPCSAASGPAASAWQRHQAAAAASVEAAQRAVVVLAPEVGDVPALDLREVFEPLVGDYGLTYSARARSLDGKRVRISGYMVREPGRHRGVFMVTRSPVRVENDGYCFFEDLPPATVHVLLSGPDAERPSPYLPGLLQLAGTLEVGTAETPDGRVSRLRLRLDPQPLLEAAQVDGASRAAPLGGQ